MPEENPFRTNLEEIVLAIQSTIQKVKFQYDVAVGNKRYAVSMINYYRGRVDQVNQDYNLITALYENAVAQNKIRGMDNGDKQNG